MDSADTVPHGRSCLGYDRSAGSLAERFCAIFHDSRTAALEAASKTMIARIGTLSVAVWALISSALCSQAQLPAVEVPLKVYLQRKGDRWVAWYWKPATGLWTIQANRTGFKDGWFTPPSYVDDGVTIRCEVPDTPMMIFRAWRVRL
jgi:hypothetical protein